MQKLTIPYVRSSPRATVIRAEDTVIELHDTYLTICINATEEIPKDDEDEYLGVKRDRKSGNATILKSGIVAIESTWDDKAESHDFVIWTHVGTWGYNCGSRNEAMEYYEKLINWLLA